MKSVLSVEDFHFIKFFELEEVVVDHVLAGHSIGFQNTCIDKGALLS